MLAAWFSMPWIYKTNRGKLCSCTHNSRDSPVWLFSSMHLSVKDQIQGCVEHPKEPHGFTPPESRRSLKANLLLTPSRPIPSVKTLWRAGGGCTELGAFRLYAERRYLDRGKKVPATLVLHGVHGKANAAASPTRHCSSASHTELPARSTYSTTRPAFFHFLPRPKGAQLKWPGRLQGWDHVLHFG